MGQTQAANGAAAGAWTGFVAGLAGGPVGAVVGAFGGAVVGAAVGGAIAQDAVAQDAVAQDAVAQDAVASPTIQHHSNACEFCEHWKNGTHYTPPPSSCNRCRQFKALHGDWVSKHKPEWEKGSGGQKPGTCLCCEVNSWLSHPSHREQVKPKIPDDVWNKVWEVALPNFAPIVTSIVEKLSQPTSVVTETKSDKDIYEEAIKSGTAKMACGRITAICDPKVPGFTPLNSILRPHDSDQTPRSYYLSITDNELATVMNKETEMDALAKLLNEVQKTGSKQGKSFWDSCKNAQDQMVIVFSNGSTSTHTPKPDLKSEIAETFRGIVTGMNHCGSWSSTKTSAIFHVSEQKEYDAFVPLFVTPRSMIFIACDAEQMTNPNPIDALKPVDKIGYVLGSLTGKADKLFVKLQSSESGKKTAPYPKIVLVQAPKDSDTPNDEGKSKWDEIKQNFTDTDQDRLRFVPMAASGTSELIEEVRKFGGDKGLLIDNPLSWELFRKIVVYSCRNGIRKIVPVEVAAYVAILCEIPPDHIIAVLNFYHEHGAFLYYGKVPHMKKYLITDPTWLYEKLAALKTPKSDKARELLTTKGILVNDLKYELWEDLSDASIQNMPDALINLMIHYNLAAEITLHGEVTSYAPPHYFVPHVLSSKTTTTNAKSFDFVLAAAPLHFCFSTRYLPPGVFVRLVVALAKCSEYFEIDFTRPIFSDEVTYLYDIGGGGGGTKVQLDRIVISSMTTSICVEVRREMYCSNEEYQQYNFSLSCKKILRKIKAELENVLGQSFGSITAHPAFVCTCQEPAHFVQFTPNNKEGIRCTKKELRSLDEKEQLWMDVPEPSAHAFTTDNSIINTAKDAGKLSLLFQALECHYKDGDDDPYELLQKWRSSSGKDAPKYLVYHLKRMGIKDDKLTLKSSQNGDGDVPKKLFQQYYEKMVNCIDADSVVSKLYSLHLITMDERDKITSAAEGKEKTRILLNAIERGITEDTFEKFLNELETEAKYKPLVDQMRGNKDFI